MTGTGKWKGLTQFRNPFFEGQPHLQPFKAEELKRRETKLSEKDRKLKEDAEKRQKEKELAELEEQKREEARLSHISINQINQ
ncbi:3521_t:CDS:2 [Entrophospora sp. SA101]|nr:9797_t:CDS:2 [Entrophospora sp. SA101]CAJ0745791.1 3521_t:CDS:2 [Entrophospora sp. SA101]CAJ0827515.1 4445_t:CDS:2 [Entrophospora sp. SA101]CAJ0838588.1 380_t:CDS:2 [Entrophospora sp. SA101]